MPEEETWVKVCPRCHSTEVTSRGPISRTALSPNYVCQSCGYQGIFFPEFKLEDLGELGADEYRPPRYTPAQQPFFAEGHKRPSELVGGKRIYYIAVLLLLMWLLLKTV